MVVQPVIAEMLPGGQGYKVRVYIPYGRNWLPYTIRRLSERKENIWFVVKNLFEK